MSVVPISEHSDDEVVYVSVTLNKIVEWYGIVESNVPLDTL